MSFKRISLNLIHYFQDYRQLSRICLNKNIESVNDLQNYISKTFDIENFHLICNNFYLPPSENIELLDDNELIYVMPDLQKQKQICQEINLKVDKKLKSKEIECNNEIKEKKKKKKKSKKEYEEPKLYHLKDTQLNEDIEISNKIINNTSNTNNELEMEICNSSDTTHNTDINETIVNSELLNSQSRPRKKRRCISPTQTTDNRQQEETCSKNKVIIQSVEIVNEKMQQKIIKTIAKSPVNKSYSLNDVIVFENKRHSVQEKTQQPIEMQHLNGAGVEKTKRQLSKEILGIGHILQSLSESDASSLMEDNFITRRRRSRVRRRKKKNIEETEPVVTNIEFKPPKTIANPKMHIKFDTNKEQEKINGENESFVCSTPMKVNNIENITILNNTQENTIYNLTLNDIDVNKCSNLLGIPNVHDLIKFKKLKIGENYTPEVSDYILAAVEDITQDQLLKMKILDGKNEFREPLGRFSCITEEEENDLEDTNEVVLALNSLIEPKLCKV